MITEQDIRAVYEGFYKIAEELGSSVYTDRISWQLQSMFTNPGLVDTRKIREVCGLASEIDMEYYQKFGKLAVIQRRVQR